MRELIRRRQRRRERERKRKRKSVYKREREREREERDAQNKYIQANIEGIWYTVKGDQRIHTFPAISLFYLLSLQTFWEFTNTVSLATYGQVMLTVCVHVLLAERKSTGFWIDPECIHYKSVNWKMISNLLSLHLSLSAKFSICKIRM